MVGVIRSQRRDGFCTLFLLVAVSTVTCEQSAPLTLAIEDPPAPVEAPAAIAELQPATVEPVGEQIAPPPYSAEEIRAATSVGRSYELVIEVPGKPTIRRRLTFTAVDQLGCTIESAHTDETGKVVGIPTVSHSTWQDLVKHASYPRETTEISDAPVETPAGSFDCLLYRVEESTPEGPMVTRAYFAKDMPGAPVKLVVEIAGELVSNMELVSYIQIRP